MRHKIPNPTLSLLPPPPPPPLPSNPDAVFEEKRRRTVEAMTKRYITRIMTEKKKEIAEITEEMRLRIQKRINESFDGYVQPDHPPYHMMIVNALEKLNEEGGLTQEAISEHIKKTFPGLPFDHECCLSKHLSKLGASGDIIITDEKRYMLPVNNSITVANKEMELKSSKQKRRGNQRVKGHKQSQGKQKVKIRKYNQIPEQENLGTETTEVDEIIERSEASGQENEGNSGEKRFKPRDVLDEMNVDNGDGPDKGNKETDNGHYMNGGEQSPLEKTEALKNHTQCKEQIGVTRGEGQRKEMRQQTELKRKPDKEQYAVQKDGEAGKNLIQVDETNKNKNCGEGSKQNQMIQELNGIHENQNEGCQANTPSDQHQDLTLVHHCSDPNCCLVELQRVRAEATDWEKRAASHHHCICSEELKSLKEEIVEMKRQIQILVSQTQKGSSLAGTQGCINGPLMPEGTHDNNNGSSLMLMDASKGESVFPAVAECDGVGQEGQHLQQIQESQTKKNTERDCQIQTIDISGLKTPPDAGATALKERAGKRKRHTELPGQQEDSIFQPISTSHQLETERQIVDQTAEMSHQRRKLRPRATTPNYLDAPTETALSVPQHQQKKMIVKQTRGRGRPPRSLDTNTSVPVQPQRRGRPPKKMQDSNNSVLNWHLVSYVGANHEEAQPVLQIGYHETETSEATKSDAKPELESTSKSESKQKKPSPRGRGRPPKLPKSF